MTEAADLPLPLAERLGVLETLVRRAEPENCGALRDVEPIVADTLALIENSLSIEGVAEAAILDCLALADELMHVGIYWADNSNIEAVRKQAVAAVEKFAAALQDAAPSETARDRGIAW
ncbi:MAG TPA: hypothetical protein VG271_02490 [Beijerinckiaceae bacterium]|nr:hypothetical protein [Beijerinckiaceae bacterium]